jgi:myo-inositol-1(or 4)-monophosphatase
LPAPEARDADFALLKETVRDAGALAMRFYMTDHKQWSKAHDNTPVTEADIAVNDLLHARLGGARPDYGWLSEETEDDSSRLTQPLVWVVDPIDGTRAFAKGHPHFAISVALVEDGRPVLGVIFNPATDEFFEARFGGGAFLNGKPIRVADHAPSEPAGGGPRPLRQAFRQSGCHQAAAAHVLGIARSVGPC